MCTRRQSGDAVTTKIPVAIARQTKADRMYRLEPKHSIYLNHSPCISVTVDVSQSRSCISATVYVPQSRSIYLIHGHISQPRSIYPNHGPCISVTVHVYQSRSMYLSHGPCISVTVHAVPELTLSFNALPWTRMSSLALLTARHSVLL